MFIQQFTVSTGLTPHQYLMKARVKRGQELLAQSTVPIAQVAVLCGFSDPSHFAALFKRTMGLTPSAYRRQAS